MAIYHLTAKPISRSTGRSAVAAASYQSGTAMHDERTGRSFDYTKKRGVVHAEIVAPANAPAWCKDRAKLWNRAEAAEKRKDAQTARSIELALPKEIPPHLHAQIVREFCHEQFVKRGMVADFAIHANQGNPHAHIMLTMRPLAGKEFSQKKDRTWNDKETLKGWREGWQDHANTWLEKVGSKERIDHRSHKERGLGHLIPTIHEGPTANAIGRKAYYTPDRKMQNITIRADNFQRQKEIIAARHEIKTAQEEIRFNRFAVVWPTFLKTIDRTGPTPVQTAIARAKAKGQEPTKTERAQIAKRVREQWARDADIETWQTLGTVAKSGKSLGTYTKEIEAKAAKVQKRWTWAWLTTGKETKAEIVAEAKECRKVLNEREALVTKEIDTVVKEAAHWKEVAEAVSGIEPELVQHNYERVLQFEKDQEEAAEKAREEERAREAAERAKHPEREREHERELGDDWGPSL